MKVGFGGPEVHPARSVVHYRKPGRARERIRIWGPGAIFIVNVIFNEKAP